MLRQEALAALRRIFLDEPAGVAAIKSLIAAPTCVVVRPEAGFIEHLEAAVRQADAGGNLVFDAQIVALCGEHGIGTILTRDQDFKHFDGLQVRVME